jgi:hypothetical protein
MGISDRIRARDDVQRGHDLLVHVVTDEEARGLFSNTDVESLTRSLDALCWVLRHDHNRTFASVLAQIEMRMEASGFRLIRSEEMIYPDGRPPRVVCLCGSTRFADAFQAANRTETLSGRIVLSVGCFAHQGDPVSPEEKLALDQLHLRKIDLADEILVLNVGGYIGDSTRREVEYANAAGKAIRFLEPAGKAA